MPKPYPRAERVEALAKEVLGEAVRELKDPRVGFVTVSRVKVSPDLRHAKVYVSVFGADEERATTIDAIRHAAPYLRSVLGREVRLKFLPQLEVLEDTTAAYGERIEHLLRAAGVSKAPEVERLEDRDEEDPSSDGGASDL
ncbi:MAG: 30S ribosome-binding factor RbfA [Actinomycetota bacterium]